MVLDGVWPPSDLDELADAIASLPELAGVHGAVSAVEAVAARLPGRAVNSMAIRLHRLDILTAPADVQADPGGPASATGSCFDSGIGHSIRRRIRAAETSTMRSTTP